MNFTDPDDAKLEGLLREAAPKLGDNGFSARVLAALPAATPARARSRRALFCTAGALTGVAVVAVRFARAPAANNDWAQVKATLQQLTQALAPLADPTIACGLLLAVLSAAYAFHVGSGFRRRLNL